MFIQVFFAAFVIYIFLVIYIRCLLIHISILPFVFGIENIVWVLLEEQLLIFSFRNKLVDDIFIKLELGKLILLNVD